ncbi:MAG: flagellar export protein FliJ [Planctomycetota bacterium]
MPFHFRFESILKLREQTRDEAGRAVAQANEAIAKIDSQAASIAAEQQQLRDQGTTGRIGKVSVDSLLTQGRYGLQLEADLANLSNTRQQLLAELSRRQEVLTAAEADVKRYERLRERAQSEFHAQQQKKDQHEMDEAAQRAYLRESPRFSG